MRVVLDTNTVLSPLLFSGTASRLVSLWQSRRITIFISKQILQEYLRVLAYPRFRLSDKEIRGLIEDERLPFVETVQVTRRLIVVRRDPEDNKSLECATAGRAQYLVTEDQPLREVGSYRGISILTVDEFLDRTSL